MAKKGGNPQNLRTPTTEEAREMGRKGGKASGKSKREKKLLRELLEEALMMDGESGNKQMDITKALIEKAVAGDTKAYEVIRDTLGQKPVEKIETEVINSIKVTLEDE